jgi:hypothetical protein
MVRRAARERLLGSSRPRKTQSQRATARGVQERTMMTVSTLEFSSARMLEYTPSTKATV